MAEKPQLESSAGADTGRLRAGGGGGLGAASDPTIGDPLVVEVRRGGSGPAVVVPWLGHDVRVTWPLDGLPQATLGVHLYEGWAVNLGTPDAVNLRPLWEQLEDDDLVTIRTARPNPSTDYVLFEGYVERIQYRCTAEGRKANVYLVDVADTLRTEELLGGQWRLSQASTVALDDPEEPLGVVPANRYDAHDCVFNPNGTGNSRGELLDLSDGTATVSVPIFTHTRDANRVAWTWGRVLLYLLYAPRLVDGETDLGTLGRLDFVELPADDGLTLAERMSANEDWLTWDPDTMPPPANSPWGRRLLGKPVNHVLEGLDWWSALLLTCQKCDLHVLRETRSNGFGTPERGLRIVCQDDARSVLVNAPSPHLDVARPWQQVRAAADVVTADLEQDCSRCVNEVDVLGAAYQREITVELVPGWAHAGDWDVDPANAPAVQAKVDATATEAWAQKYNRSGPLHERDGHWERGRLWGLNTCGTWDDYGRTFAPWVEDKYKLLDLHTLRLVDQEGAHAVTQRVPQQCLTGISATTPYPPVIEVSFDAGAHWRYLAALPQVSQRDLRVYLEMDDLRQETQNNASWPNFGYTLPEAYIRGQLRLRMTCGVTLDTRFGFTGLTGTTPTLSGRRRRAVVQRPRELLHTLRDDDVPSGEHAGNSQWNKVLYPAAPTRYGRTRNDSQAALALGGRVLAAADRVKWRGPVALPDLVFPEYAGGDPTGGFRPGDCVAALASEETINGGAAPRWWTLVLAEAGGPGDLTAAPLIAQVEWWRVERPLACGTRLTLGDNRSGVVVGGGR